jgi:hypothetical protein
MQKQLCSRIMRILVKVIDTLRIEGAGLADQTMHLVTFAQQKLGQIGAVLSRNSGDQCLRHAFLRSKFRD